MIKLSDKSDSVDVTNASLTAIMTNETKLIDGELDACKILRRRSVC